MTIAVLEDVDMFTYAHGIVVEATIAVIPGTTCRFGDPSADARVISQGPGIRTPSSEVSVAHGIYDLVLCVFAHILLLIASHEESFVAGPAASPSVGAKEQGLLKREHELE